MLVPPVVQVAVAVVSPLPVVPEQAAKETTAVHRPPVLEITEQVVVVRGPLVALAITRPAPEATAAPALLVPFPVLQLLTPVAAVAVQTQTPVLVGPEAVGLAASAAELQRPVPRTPAAVAAVLETPAFLLAPEAPVL
jgi:hypothetical protein